MEHLLVTLTCCLWFLGGLFVGRMPEPIISGYYMRQYVEKGRHVMASILGLAIFWEVARGSSYIVTDVLLFFEEDMLYIALVLLTLCILQMVGLVSFTHPLRKRSAGLVKGPSHLAVTNESQDIAALAWHENRKSFWSALWHAFAGIFSLWSTYWCYYVAAIVVTACMEYAVDTMDILFDRWHQSWYPSLLMGGIVVAYLYNMVSAHRQDLVTPGYRWRMIWGNRIFAGFLLIGMWAMIYYLLADN